MSTTVPTYQEFENLEQRVSDLENAPSSTGSGMTHTVYDTGDNSEMVNVLPITATKTAIYSVEISDLAVGDILVIAAESEMTNDTGSNVGVWSQIVQTDSISGVSGTEISEANGYNVTPAMHHGTYKSMAVFKVTDNSDKFINFVAWAGSAGTSADLIVEQDYGRLNILKISGV